MREVADIHRPFVKWLDERRIPYIYHRTDRRSGIQEGQPDFTILWMRRNIMIECKTTRGRLSAKQIRRIEFLRRSGNVVEIARNLSECIRAAQNVLCEGKPATEAYDACNYPLESCFRELKRAVASVPVNSSKFYIGTWSGTRYVFAPDQEGSFRMIRKATLVDEANLPGFT